MEHPLTMLRDGYDRRSLVAFLGLLALYAGAGVERWGATTELWRYFTRERPPLWILPAWPAAALTLDRLR